jgi:hypothetical protein
MPGRPLTPVPKVDEEPELDRPTLASPPPDFGLDDPTAEHPFPFDLRFTDSLDIDGLAGEVDDRPTPVDAEPPRRDTDPGSPPESE